MQNDDKKLLEIIVVCSVFLLCAFLILILIVVASNKYVEEESLLKDKPEKVIEEVYSDVESIQGIAQEEVEDYVSSSGLTIETVQEQNDKVVNTRTVLEDIVNDICEDYENVRPELIIAMIETESIFKSQAQNGECVGLMQVNKRIHAPRAEKLGVSDLFDPYGNVLVGIDYFNDLLNDYDGSEEKALVAYNCGHYYGEITPYATKILNRSYELANE